MKIGQNPSGSNQVMSHENLNKKLLNLKILPSIAFLHGSVIYSLLRIESLLCSMHPSVVNLYNAQYIFYF